MLLQFILPALALGALSSFHCVGMCGSIAFSLPTGHLSTAKKLAGILLYNTGRISTYAVLGLFFGLLGSQFKLIGIQNLFSIIAGVLILLFVIQTILNNSFPRIKMFYKLNYRIQLFIASFLQHKKLYGMFLLGVGNGLLPCGMVYLAVTGALASGSLTGGLLFMTAFGAGTFPAMFLLSWFGFVISISARNTMKKIVPYVVGIMGILLILRGMGVGMHEMNSLFPASGHIIACPQ